MGHSSFWPDGQLLLLPGRQIQLTLLTVLSVVVQLTQCSQVRDG